MSETTTQTRTIYQGRILTLQVVDVALENGTTSTREIIRHPGAAVILAQLPDGRFVFVSQYRKPVEAVTVEAVAGTLEPGENPLACAERELKEETGYEAAEFVKLGQIFPAPGYTDEILHLYYARLQPVQGSRQPDEDEHLRNVYLTAAQIERMIESGEIADAKTIASWWLYGRKVLAGKEALP